MLYTVEVYKRDARVKAGERLVKKVDVDAAKLSVLEFNCDSDYPAARGYRWAIHETFVERKNMMTGTIYKERYDTPISCSPASETFWSM